MNFFMIAAVENVAGNWPVFDSRFNVTVTTAPVHTPSIQYILAVRYGLITARLNRPKFQLLDLHVCLASLAEREDPFDIDLRRRATIQYFVSTLLSSDCVPHEIWDLSPLCSISLPRVPLPYFVVKPFLFANGSIGYILQPRNIRYRRPWDLVVHSAIDVIHCARAGWGPSLEDVACELFLLGIPFHTVSFYADIPPAPVIASPTNHYIRWRPASFRADKFDYITYTRERDTLLSRRNMRAAVLKGGILWRLCRHAFQKLERICQPSSEMLVNGQAVDLYQCYWDDSVSSSEVDILCGMYYVSTDPRSTFNSPGQVAKQSWWPTPNAWAKSGLAVGYWSSSAEIWFQKRLADINSGRAKLYSSDGWVRQTRLYVSKQKKILQRCEEFCVDVVQWWST